MKIAYEPFNIIRDAIIDKLKEYDNGEDYYHFFLVSLKVRNIKTDMDVIPEVLVYRQLANNIGDAKLEWVDNVKSRTPETQEHEVMMRSIRYFIDILVEKYKDIKVCHAFREEIDLRIYIMHGDRILEMDIPNYEFIPYAHIKKEEG